MALARESHAKDEYHPRLIVYFSPFGDFTIRCMQLETSFSGRKWSIWQIVLHEAVSIHDNDIEVIDTKYGLTKREKEMFTLLVKGFNASEVSKTIGINWETAKLYV